MKLIILDRDGVINYDSVHYIKSPEEFLPIPGSLEALGKLKRSGFTIALATNQSGIGRGLYNERTLEKIHEKLQQCAAYFDGKIDFICYCPHHPSDKCDCRKPNIGLLQQIQYYFNTSIKNCYFVGDSLSDIEAALRAECIPILVKTGKGRFTMQQLGLAHTISMYENLLDFVNHVC